MNVSAELSPRSRRAHFCKCTRRIFRLNFRIGDRAKKILGALGAWLEVYAGATGAACAKLPTAEELAKGEKRKRIGVKIWCECEVTHVANGETTLEDPDSGTCKKLAKAGAVRVRWPEDLTRDTPEPETFSWHILQDALWREDKHMGWRYSMRNCGEHHDA